MGDQQSSMEQDLNKGGFSWRRLLVWTTAGLIAMVIIFTAVEGFDPFALVVGIPMLVGLFLLTRKGKVGPIAILILTLLLGGMMFWLVFGLQAAASPVDFIPSLLFVTSVVFGLIASIAAIARKRDLPEESKGAKATGIIYALVLVLGLGYTAYARATFESDAPQADDIRLVAQNVKFDSSTLEAEEGTVSVHVTNRDNVMHTFSIDELDVELLVPGGKSARVTFDAKAGTYDFYCAPHSDDMKGKLEVG